MLLLTKNSLLEVDHEFEEVIQEIFLNATHRLRRTRWLKKKSIKFFEKRNQSPEEDRKSSSNDFLESL